MFIKKVLISSNFFSREKHLKKSHDALLFVADGVY